MKKLIISAVLLLMFIGVVSAQVFDSFEDGDYTSDPTWNLTDTSGGVAGVHTNFPFEGSFNGYLEGDSSGDFAPIKLRLEKSFSDSDFYNTKNSFYVKSDIAAEDLIYLYFEDSDTGDYIKIGLEHNDNLQDITAEGTEFSGELIVADEVNYDFYHKVGLEVSENGDSVLFYTDPANQTYQELNVSLSEGWVYDDVYITGDDVLDTTEPYINVWFDSVNISASTTDTTETADSLGESLGGSLAEFTGKFFEGFFNGIENNVSESNQNLIASIIAVIFGIIAGVLSRSSLLGVGTMVLTVLGFTVQGWMPSWIGFVFVVITAGIIAFLGSKIGGG